MPETETGLGAVQAGFTRLTIYLTIYPRKIASSFSAASLRSDGMTCA
jgi:hypothetical protein